MFDVSIFHKRLDFVYKDICFELDYGWLRKIAKNQESRYIYYKKELEAVHRDKINFPPEDPDTIWYKEFLRESKNSEESAMKKTREEIEYLRQGMNTPSCYP